MGAGCLPARNRCWLHFQPMNLAMAHHSVSLIGLSTLQFILPSFTFIFMRLFSISRPVLLLGLLSALPLMQAQVPSASAAFPQYGAVEDMGIPLQTTQVVTGAVTEEDGVPILVTAISGDPARLNIFDLENDQVLRSFDVPFGKTFWIHGTDSAGDVFFAGYSGATLYQYSVKDKQLKEVGRLSGEHAACALTFDDEDNVYIGTYPNAKIIKYNRATGQLEDLGVRLKDHDYFKSLVYYDGYLYGGGQKTDADFVRVHLKTLKVEKLPKPNIGEGVVESYYYASRAGDLLFMDTTLSGRKRSVFVFDMKAGKWLDVEFPGGSGLSATPEMDGKVYFTANGGVWEFDLATSRAKEVMERYRGSFRVRGAVSLKSDERFAEPSYVNLLYGGGIAIYNFKTGEQKRYSSKLEPAGGVISALTHVGNDLLIGQFMGPRLDWYDPSGEKKTVVISMSQAESVVAHDGKIYVGTYPAAAVNVYDPKEPMARNKNPQQLFNLKEEGQSRPFGLTFSGSRLVVGMTADYGMTEGALGVYDLNSGELKTYKNILPDLSYTALTEKDGIVWGSTTVFGGLGGDPVASEAQLFSFDPEKGRIIRSAAPRLPNVSQPVKAWGAATIGPDGRLWAIAYGTVAVIDPQTLRVIKVAEVSPTNWNRQARSWAHYSLEFTQEGFLVCNPNHKLIILNPANMEWKDLLPEKQDSRIGRMTITENGDIYFVDLNDSSRLQRMTRK